MSQPSASAPAALAPTFLDYFLLLSGFALTLWLLSLYPPVPPASEDENLSPAMKKLAPELPNLVRLPQGVILLWPIFLLWQTIQGRKQSLTAGEWLWVFSWLGTAVVVGLAAWSKFGTLPEVLQNSERTVRVVWFVILTSAIAAAGIIIGFGGLIWRVRRPWTHTCALALVIWPALPLLGILALGRTNVL